MSMTARSPIDRRLVFSRIATIVVAITLFGAGVMKIIDPIPTVKALVAIEIPEWTARMIAVGLPGVELALGCGLVFLRRSALVARLTMVLLAAFTLFLLVLYIKDPAAGCACFAMLGDWWPTSSPLWGVARNVALAGLLGLSLRWHQSGDHQPVGPFLQRPVTPVLILLILLVPAPRVQAQWGFPHEQPWGLGVSQDSIERLIETVRLSDGQEVVLRELYASAVDEFAVFAKAGRAREKELKAAYRGLRHGSIEYHMGSIDCEREVAKLADRQTELNQEALQQLKSVLNEDQFEDWDTWVRWNFRRLQVRQGLFTEEDVDIVAIVEHLEIQASDSLNPELFDLTLLQYERQLDTALRARLTHIVELTRNRWQWKLDHTTTDGANALVSDARPGFLDRANERSRKRREVHERIRDLSRSTSSLLASLLDGDNRHLFDQAYQRGRVPWIQRPNHQQAIRYIEVVLALDSLSESQRAAIAGMRLQYESRVGRANRRVRDSSDAHMESRFVPVTVSGNSIGDREKLAAERAAVDAMNARSELVNRTCTSVFMVLSPEQATLCPKPEPLPMLEE